MAQKLVMTLAAAVLAFGIQTSAASRPAQAVGLCTCCLDPLPQSCSAACEARGKTSDQCSAFVIYSGEGAAGPNGNPLNAMSLKELDVGTPRRTELEDFRRFLEKYRRKAIVDWRKAVSAYDRGKLAKDALDALDAASALYRDALVGYYHGISAYRRSIGSAPE